MVTLSVFGVLLGIADATSRRTKLLDHMTWRDAILFGFAQALALIPGVSRSGGTITAGLLMGYTREAAARYSFLLAIPAVLGVGLLQAVHRRARGRGATRGRRCSPPSWPSSSATSSSSGSSSWSPPAATCRSSIYRLVLAAVVVVLLLTGAVEATSALATSAG